MEICVDIDDELLGELDHAAHNQHITREVAFQGAVSAWLSQARRDAALRMLFEPEYGPGSPDTN